MSLLRTIAICVPAVACCLGDLPAAEGPGVPVEAARPKGWRQMQRPAEARRPLPPVPLLIERLGSPKFAERAAATRDLARSGAAAVAALREAAQSDRPEVSVRAVTALEDLWLRAMESEDDAAAAAALTALDELSLAGDPALRARVESLLGAYASHIERHAMNELRRLGATFKYNPGVLLDNEDGTMTPSIQHVVIGTKWTGGEEGLRHIRRLRRGVGTLGVYIIRGAELPEGAIDRFQAAVDPREVQVTERGSAYLGVSGVQLPVRGVEGCLVSGVEPNTPAAKGGVRPDDVIVEFNGKKVADFDQLVEEIKSTVPGQTVDVRVVRQGIPADLKVTMEAWEP
ncbi:MAG TPA: PDZ domain-containing protein, partial [Planctomycetaceae bacterium]